MTPNEILEEVKQRPLVLYHDDPVQLERLLRQALGKYQDKAGAILEVWENSDAFEIPANFQAVAGCCDSLRRYMPWRWGTKEVESEALDENGNLVTETVTVKAIQVVVGKRHVAPYCLYYFCDLRHWDGDADLPPDCSFLLADYLEALLNVVNVERQKAAYFSMGMGQAAQELQNLSELRQRVTELELMMEDNKALIPPASQF